MDLLQQCQTQSFFQLPTESWVYVWLLAIKDFYKPIHTYLSIVLCALGAICNFCNIVVLTRRKMRTPVNMILTAMACCDTVVLFSNLTYTTHYTFVAFEHCVPKHWSYGWCVFLISHAHLSLVFHSSSIWLSVMLALIRYLTLRRRGKACVQIGLKHSYVSIACVILFVSLMNAPNFLTYKITEQTLGETCGDLAVLKYKNHTAYIPGVADIALKSDCLVFRLAFWITGAVFKLFPCLLLTVLVSLLTQILKEVRANRQRLFFGGGCSSSTFEANSSQQFFSEPISTQTAVLFLFPVESSNNQNNESSTTATRRDVLPQNNGNNNNSNTTINLLSPPPITSSTLTLNNRNDCTSSSFMRKGVNATTASVHRTDRTTRMLLAIVCVFLVTELPQGIIAVMSGMFSEEFRSHIYNNLGDILDLLSLCNALASFIIYCSMSAQFRNEFRRVFLPTTQRVKCWRQLLVLTRRRKRNDVENIKFERRQESGGGCEESDGLVEEQEQNNTTTKSPLLRRPTTTQQQKQQHTIARNGCLSGERK
uniref:G-protein coupled receptors family 1 profile domain-containing protein n=3 Tax=Meloidogyne TaxID=189290 RepID=A0A914MX87_MELIC